MSSGTQSPPLEATGEHQPIGAASKDGKPLAEGVKDSEQRGQYFGNKSATQPQTGSGPSEAAISAADHAAKNVEVKDSHS
ncbi:GEF1 protein [Ceratobasidium sp. AG-Ba]|nr:GEF1 protein [Ceratobasidium sp. AG-Ba]QRV90892.1 GEF1 protein [Ceratobasidium sp. AG-Ba]QRW04983.1 GEF1 protein [Ceratobasidium sp. AG-Ba]